jgi:hypothetical protein
MVSVLRRAAAVAALVAVSAVTAQAQMGSLKVEEIRIDIANFSTVDGSSDLTLFAPGALALGIYLNDKIAIEPMILFNNDSPDVGDATNTIGIGVMVPFYLQGDRGHNGFFIAPGFQWRKVGDADAGVDFGADIGYKKSMNDKVSWRAAANIQTGDSTADEMLIGVTFGFSVFWR